MIHMYKLYILSVYDSLSLGVSVQQWNHLHCEGYKHNYRLPVSSWHYCYYYVSFCGKNT